MRVVALMTVRNEELYIEETIRHLAEQGVDVCLIDNESGDSTLRIAKSLLGRGIIRIVSQPYVGHFDLVEQCRVQEKLSKEIEADWFIHQDADEIIEAPAGYGSLNDALRYVENLGDNAVNCDEFVFLPLTGQDFTNRNFKNECNSYYFFEPAPLRLIRLWKKTPFVLLSESGGHGAAFPDRKLHQTPFVLRHYIALSLEYLQRKYQNRSYSPMEVKKGWHGWRAAIHEWRVELPPADNLKTYHFDNFWDKSDPKKQHQFLVEHLV